MSADSRARTITSVQEQREDSDRVSVVLEGDRAFGVDRDLAGTYNLREGRSLTPEQEREIKREDQYRRAKHRALEYVAHKRRTEAEVRRTLRQDEVSTDIADDAVAHLDELGYLDDEAYARDYARNRFANKKYGPVRIRRELIERGIPRSVAEMAVEDLFADRDPEAAARDHAQKRWERLRDEDDPRRRKQKMYRYLRRRGFTSDTIYSVLDDVERRTHS